MFDVRAEGALPSVSKIEPFVAFAPSRDTDRFLSPCSHPLRPSRPLREAGLSSSAAFHLRIRMSHGILDRYSRMPRLNYFGAYSPMKLLRLATVCTVASLIGVSVFAAEEKKAKKPPVSPRDLVAATIGGNEIKIDYGRPYTKSPKTGEMRKVWGGLVPYDAVWRTGANEATLLTIAKPIVIGGFDLPAGSYTLFTVPTATGEGSKLIINKKTGQWGIPYHEDEEKENELARVDLQRGATKSALHQFTITIEPTGPNAGKIVFAWEDAFYSVDFKNKS
jgi:hypothetical protein